MASRVRTHGFTLIEMIVVLAVLSLVGAIVVTRGPQRSAVLDLRQAVSTVAGTLRLARSQAVASDRPVAVLLDPRAAALQVAGSTPRHLPAGIAMAVTVPEDEGSSIVFLPDGSATGGQVVLSTRGRSARIAVEWLSGQVAVAALNDR